MIERVAEAVRRYDEECLTHVPARPDDIRGLLARIECLEAALRKIADGGYNNFAGDPNEWADFIARAALTSSDTPDGDVK